AVGQGRDQVAEHLRAGREAVQQEYRRRVLWPGLAVEDVQVTDLDRPVGHSLLDHGISWGRVGVRWPRLTVSGPCGRWRQGGDIFDGQHVLPRINHDTAR